MISVAQAEALVLSTALPLPTEAVALEDATGRVLREALVADRDFPPFDRVSMDGIAIRQEAFASGRREYEVHVVLTAGTPKGRLDSADACVEIMTGAVCPEGADSVIRYEDIEIEEREGRRYARILIDEVKPGQNVHGQGTDRQAGETLLDEARILTGADLAVAATVGKNHVLVSRLPRVAIVSTGDELVEVDEMPLPHQIRMSNGYALAAGMADLGIRANRYHLTDNKDLLKEKLGRMLKDHDALILSGGVSRGRTDFVPEVLDALGVNKLFHKVQQRPGKPFWFGQIGQTAVFGLPGNPVSAFVGLHRYVRPWLKQSLGLSASERMMAALSEDVAFRPALTYFLQVRVVTDAEGRLIARPIVGRGSGDLANLLDCNALLELPADRSEFLRGETFPIIALRDF